MVTHYPDRPDWVCRVDGLPWPCETARAELTESLSPTYRARYMGGFYADAATELPASVNLWERFYGWINDPSPQDAPGDQRQASADTSG